MGTKLLTADEFIAMARAHTYPAEQVLHDETIYGWIRWDATQPDYVLFSYVRELCARVPLHKDRIESIQIGSTFTCYGEGGQHWSATIRLRRP